MKRALRVAGVLAAVIAALVGLRAVLAPPRPRPIEMSIPDNELAHLRRAVGQQIMDVSALGSRLLGSRIWLIGETHGYREPLAFLMELLDGLGDEKVVLLLELPKFTQTSIDRFLSDGDERTFDVIWSGGGALPYYDILRWAWRHRDRVVGLGHRLVHALPRAQ